MFLYLFWGSIQIFSQIFAFFPINFLCPMEEMCLVVLAYKVSPQFPVLIVSNRDEFFERQTAPLSEWSDHPGIYAGRDLKAGGTWLGGSASGRLAFLTNVRNLKKTPHPSPKSRGALVKNFLISGLSAKTYSEMVLDTANLYEGFNLAVFDGGEFYFVGSDPKQIFRIEPGIHSVSNASWNTDWPKTKKASSAVTKILDSKASFSEADFFGIMDDTDVVKDPNSLPDTGLGVAREQALSSVRIVTPQYGTRASTVVFYKEREVKIAERSFKAPPDVSVSDKTLVYQISS
ncbi:NRDE family protein [Leptospira sp. 96542]|nr:NRDE family protein [Leptospira sp. 96542]